MTHTVPSRRERASQRAAERLEFHLGPAGADVVRSEPIAKAVYDCAFRALFELELAIDGRMLVPIPRQLDPAETIPIGQLSAESFLGAELGVEMGDFFRPM